MKVIPSKSQWNRWSLPSKLTAVGTFAGVVGLVISLIGLIDFPTSETLEPEIVELLEAPLKSKLVYLDDQLESYKNGLQSLHTTFRNIDKVVIDKQVAVSFIESQETNSLLIETLVSNLEDIKLEDLKKIASMHVFRSTTKENYRNFIDFVKFSEIAPFEWKAAEYAEVLRDGKVSFHSSEAMKEYIAFESELKKSASSGDLDIDQFINTININALQEYVKIYDILEYILLIDEESSVDRRSSLILSIDDKWLKSQVTDFLAYERAVLESRSAEPYKTQPLFCRNLTDHILLDSLDLYTRFTATVCATKINEAQTLNLANTSLADCVLHGYVQGNYSCMDGLMEEASAFAVEAAAQTHSMSQEEFKSWVYKITSYKLTGSQLGRLITKLLVEVSELSLLHGKAIEAICSIPAVQVKKINTALEWYAQEYNSKLDCKNIRF